MRTTILFISMLCFLNCNGQNKNSDVKATGSASDYSSIFKILKDNLIKNVKRDNPDFEVENYDNNDYFSLELRSEGAPYGGYYFSKKKEDQIFGDLNADGVDDIVVSVESNSGGNTSYTDYYLFLSNNGKYELANPDSWDIPAQCDKEGYGRFVLMEISNGKLIGESQCMTENDPRCCPSVIYTTVFELDDGYLNWVSTDFKENRTVEDYQSN